jgi:hypothetical protein
MAGLQDDTAEANSQKNPPMIASGSDPKLQSEPSRSGTVFETVNGSQEYIIKGYSLSKEYIIKEVHVGRHVHGLVDINGRSTFTLMGKIMRIMRFRCRSSSLLS